MLLESHVAFAIPAKSGQCEGLFAEFMWLYLFSNKVNLYQANYKTKDQLPEIVKSNKSNNDEYIFKFDEYAHDNNSIVIKTYDEHTD